MGLRNRIGVAALAAVMASVTGCGTDAGSARKSPATPKPTPAAVSTIDIKKFFEFRATNAPSSTVDVLSEDGVFVATATVAAEDYEFVSDLGTVSEDGKEYGVQVNIDFVADQSIKMVNFPKDHEEYEFAPRLVMSRADASAEPDPTRKAGQSHYAHFELQIHAKEVMFPDGKDLVITFEGVTNADDLGARIAPGFLPLDH